MLRVKQYCERCNKELTGDWKSLICDECREKERLDSIRKSKINNEEETPTKCSECGIELNEDNCKLVLNNRLEDVISDICISCTERIDKELAIKEREESLLMMEASRMLIDDYIVSKINYGIPEMYKNVPPSIPFESLKSKTALIYGDFGTGKTYTAYSFIKNERIRYIHWSIEISGNDINELRVSLKGIYNDNSEEKALDNMTVKRAFTIMKELKDGFRTGDSDKIFKKYVNKEILIIDEYGKNMGSEYEEATLFELINTRYEELKQTILIVNASNKNELLEIIRPDILDRFRSNLIEINGRSRR